MRPVLCDPLTSFVRRVSRCGATQGLMTQQPQRAAPGPWQRGGSAVIDQTYAGVRCRTRYLLRTVHGDLPWGSQGTVAYEMDNLSRHLLLVTWDQAMSVPVLPHEIEVSPAP